MTTKPSGERLTWVLFGLTLGVLALSGIRPHDYPTWALEVFPVVLVWPVILATRRRFPLTPLVLVLVFVHGVILMIGGHWTYARVPLGHWVQEAFGLARNHYDRVGHVAQGFVPAIALREILLRLSPLRRGRWLAFLTVAACLGFSAFYELIEWWVAVVSEQGAIAFLGTQGDVWDTQWDMFLCMLGSIAALALLGRMHDRQLLERGWLPEASVTPP